MAIAHYDDLPMNWVGDWAGRRAELNADRPALYDSATDTRYNYAELNERANRVGAYLLDRGLKKGDKVCFIARNRIEPVDLFLACGKLGIILAPLSYRLTKPELDDLLSRIQPQLLVYEALFAELVDSLVLPSSVAGTIALGEGEDAYQREVLATAPREINQPLSMNDTCLYIHTGGSTATPKVCVVPYRQMLWNAIELVATSLYNTDKRMLLSFPLFHIGGWNTLVPLLYYGDYSVLVRQFEPTLFLRLIEQERITYFGGVEIMFQMLAAEPSFSDTDLSSLTAIVSAGAPCSAEAMQPFWDRGVPVTQYYGLTEAGPSNFAYSGIETPMDTLRATQASVGRAMYHCDHKIVDADSGEPVARGETGVLCLRSPHNFQEYLDQPERSDKLIDAEGWVYTGDLAREDERGLLYIVGRSDNMFISGGENVSPEEIEQILTSHPSITQAAVIGMNDPRWGQVPLAAVATAPGATPTEEELSAYCSERLARYKVPKRYLFLSSLPLTGAGKLDRNAVRAQAEQ